MKSTVFGVLMALMFLAGMWTQASPVTSHVQGSTPYVVSAMKRLGACRALAHVFESSEDYGDVSKVLVYVKVSIVGIDLGDLTEPTYILDPVSVTPGLNATMDAAVSAAVRDSMENTHGITFGLGDFVHVR